MTAAPTVEKLRAWWAHRQALDGRLAGADPAEVLARTGWARSVGGANPYVSLFARAGTGRGTVDADVAALDIHELPSTRGCTYVLPAEHFALGLALSEGAARAPLATAASLGVPEAEIDALGDAVVKTLDGAGAPMDPASLRAALGDTVRTLGPEGKRKGLSTTLPVALGLLQSAGEIRRVPVNGRLDQQRYGYARWADSPSRSTTFTPEEARTELARLYFSWTGPASLAHFRWFSAFGVRDAKQAVAPLGLRPVEGTDLLIRPEDAEDFAAFVPPSRPDYALVTWIDGVLLLRRDLAALLDPSAGEISVLGSALRGLGDLPTQAITDRGRVVGLWEFDPDAGTIVWASFAPPDTALREAVARTEVFVQDQLGDVRGMSLDSPAARRPRLEALRTLAR